MFGAGGSVSTENKNNISSEGEVLKKFILCFQFLQLMSIYYFVKSGGKEHQHHLNDAAYVVDMLW